MDNACRYSVTSSNFPHEPVPCVTYLEAYETAKSRGFEAHINYNDGDVACLVATWSPLYGTKLYNREFAVRS